MDLSARLAPVRISACASKELDDQSKATGRSPSQWVRDVVYKALGLTPAGERE